MTGGLFNSKWEVDTIKLNETVELMNSADYKDRFKAEYYQLVNRIEGLFKMLEKIIAGTLPFEPKCSQELLYMQLNAMKAYRLCLEDWAKLEDINLIEERG